MKIEKAISEIEYKLSRGASFPIVGTIPAVAKIALGIIQASIALLFTFFSAPFALCSQKARTFCKRSATHIVHGGGNILDGILEAIPGLGTYINCKRPFDRNPKGGPVICWDAQKVEEKYEAFDGGQNDQVPILMHFNSSQCGKFLAYSELIPESTVHIWHYQESITCQESGECKNNHITHNSTHYQNLTYNESLQQGIGFFLNQGPHWLSV